jgi:hypothetical protein
MWREAPGRGRLSPVRAGALALIWVLGIVSGVWLVGCSSDSINGRGGGSSSTVAGVLASTDLGAVVFDVYRGQISSEPAGPARDARLAALDARRTAFVKAVNDIVNVNTVQNVAQTVDALYALVDDGTLPTLTDHVASTLNDLAGDPAALDAVLNLLQNHRGSSLPLEDVISLLGRMFNYPETERLWRAVAQLIEDNDGVDAAGVANGEPRLVQDLLAFLRDVLLQSSSAPAGRLQGAMDEVFGALTEEAQINGSVNFGPPEWVVRIGDRGLPRVATDASGRPRAPFVDSDGDGLADIDAQRNFVDAAGQALDLPPFGEANAAGFDAAGRATGGGGLLYDYVDAKRTNLALFLQLGGELLRRDVAKLGHEVLASVLGTPAAGGGFSPDNPLADLGFGLLSLLEPDVAGPMLRITSDVIRRDPDLAERFVLAFARGLDASRSASGQSAFVGLSDPRVQDLIDDMLPLLDDVFETPTTGGRSTASHLNNTLAQLHTTSPDIGHQLAPLLHFVQVERETTPDSDRNDIDESRSAAVDRAQPAWIGSTDNRSALHQLLDLLARADGCSIIGNNLAVLILDLMADQSSQTVGSLVNLLNSLPGFLPNLVCSGISRDLASLDALAKSGALDALLPLVKAFKDRGEVPLLVRILVRIQADYETVLRPVEEDLIPFLESGVVESVLELIELAGQVRDPQTSESAADLIARGLEFVVDDDAPVLDARGVAVPSRAHLLIQPLTQLEVHVRQNGLGTTSGALADAIYEVFLERVSVNGQERLRNESLIPLVARVAEAFAKALPADAATRRQEISQGQQALRDAIAHKNTATLLALVNTIYASQSKTLITQAVVDLLTPKTSTPNDIFGGLAKVSVILLQSPPQASAFQGLAPFLARVVDPQSPLVPDSVRAFQRLLTADQGQTVLNLLRAALNPPTGSNEPPATTLLRVVQAVSDAGSQSGAALDRAQLQADLRGIVAFLRDSDGGLHKIYDMIRTRQVR